MGTSSRFSALLDHPWLVGALVLAALVLGIQLVPRAPPEPPLELVALGPGGGFRDTLAVPAAWGDTSTTAGGVVRVPLVLGVRNTGARSARPERLDLSLPVQYRLTGPEGGLEPTLEAGSPLVAYKLRTGLGVVEPGRLPELLPAQDTIWMEVVVPAYYCVLLADSVPEFIPAPTPPLETLREVRIFYSFEGSDLAQRRTGTLTIRLDTALLYIAMPERPPSFPATVDTGLASPDIGPLRPVGERVSECGDPQQPVELRSALSLTATGGRVIALEHGGVVRKRLYDLDGDGVIERESWDADADGTLESTRRARLPIPEFLLPVQPAATPDTVPAPG